MVVVLAFLLAFFASSPSFASSAASPLELESFHKLQDPHLVEALRHPKAAFEAFLRRFEKNYTGEAIRLRFGIFKRNLLVAVENQLADPSAVHGISQFSDLTAQEFAENFLGLKKREGSSASPRDKGFAVQGQLPPDDIPTGNLPKEFDWREKGAVTPVKNQGMCGSCYSFSAVQAVEGAHFLATGNLVALSPQQAVDCDSECDPVYHDVCDSGCNGGLMANVLTYFEKVGGVEAEEDYPYKGKQGTCKFDKSKTKASVGSFKAVPVAEDQIAAHLVRYGPLAVAINAAWMQTYVRGVSCPILCDRKGLDHGVLLVGYGTHGFSPARLRFKPFWIIKNSWGPRWGEEGYYRICSGKDECGLNTMISAVVAAGVQAKPESGVQVQ